MAVFRTVVTTVSSSFDWVVKQLENHEALVANAIRDLQVAGGRARAQLAKIRQDGTRIRTRIEEQRIAAERWEERARSIASENKEKAMECLKRRNALQKEISALEVQERTHSKIESQLTQDLIQMEARIDELKRKKNQFAARESRQEVIRSHASDNLGLIGELDDIFERWEDKIAQCEPVMLQTDNLEAEFVKEEETAQLAAELDGLLAERKY